MTVENLTYGGGWLKCGRCTVHDAVARRVYDKVTERYACIDVKQCDKWIAELAAKGLRPGVDSVQTFAEPVGVPLVTTVPRGVVTKTDDQLVRDRQEKASAELKAWAGKPWINPHRNGKVTK